MKILYRSSDKSPSDGDVKILKNGDIFFRAQQIYQGMYVVSSGKPSYSWYQETDQRIERYKKEYENQKDNGKKLFYSTTETKKRKTKTVKFDFSLESDRKRYEELTGIEVTKETTIKTASLQISI